MRLIKISFLFTVLAVFSSCLKSKNDIAGTRNDDGGISISILEDEYIDQDNNLIGSVYAPFANFDFTTPATEQVQFFTVHISQPRTKKVSGSLKLTITAVNGPNGDPLPSGALTVTPTVEIPAFTGTAKDVPVKFSVNKAALDPSAYYSVLFRITASDQGTISENMREIEVFIYPGKYYGRYMVETTVTDPLNLVKITKNTKPALLDDLAFSFGGPLFPDQNYLSYFDEYFAEFTGSSQALSVFTDNLSSGTTAVRYPLFYPTYHLNASGAVDGVFNTLTGANYNVTFTNDLANKYVYTDNGTRTMEVSYNITLSAPILGGTSSRVFHVQEKYSYHPIQVRIYY